MDGGIPSVGSSLSIRELSNAITELAGHLNAGNYRFLKLLAELSYSKVRALTRVACKGNEEYFMQIALHGTAHHVETLVRHYRHCQEAAELSREARQHESRSLSYYFDGDGSLVLKASLPAEAGALLIKALDVAISQLLDGGDVSAETLRDRTHRGNTLAW
jgi:hypothetical protein